MSMTISITQDVYQKCGKQDILAILTLRVLVSGLLSVAQSLEHIRVAAIRHKVLSMLTVFTIFNFILLLGRAANFMLCRSPFLDKLEDNGDLMSGR